MSKMERMTTSKMLKLKRPKLQAPIIKVLSDRFSPTLYSEKPVSEKEIKSIFEASRWAPSGYNHQPWFFYWARKGTVSYKKIIICLSDRNQWAETAPLLVVACRTPRCEHCPNGENKFAAHDLGSAVMAAIIEAQSLGVYSRQMGMFDYDKIVKLLKIPAENVPTVVIAMGRLGDYAKVNDAMLEKEMKGRIRKNVIAKKI